MAIRAMGERNSLLVSCSPCSPYSALLPAPSAPCSLWSLLPLAPPCSFSSCPTSRGAQKGITQVVFSRIVMAIPAMGERNYLLLPTPPAPCSSCSLCSLCSVLPLLLPVGQRRKASHKWCFQGSSWQYQRWVSTIISCSLLLLLLLLPPLLPAPSTLLLPVPLCSALCSLSAPCTFQSG